MSELVAWLQLESYRVLSARAADINS